MEDLRYDRGSYMMRTCGSSWEYCNGICKNCFKSNSFNTNVTPMSRNDIESISDRTDYIVPNGIPSYLTRRKGDFAYDV